MKLEVDCYAGRETKGLCVFDLTTAPMFSEVLNQWYGPEDAFYGVRADDGNISVLEQETPVPAEVGISCQFSKRQNADR